MKLIGIEEHFLTLEVRGAWNAIGLEALDPSLAHNSGVIERRLIDLADERLALMDEAGLDVAVLSLTTPMLHDLGPESVEIARRTNDAVATVLARHPTRFEAFATLPVSMPELATAELDRCIKTLGFKGAMLCGRVGPHNLDDLMFSPIFECAAALGAPVMFHPRTPPMAVREAYYSGFTPEIDTAISTYGLGWHYDAGIQFLRLVLAGTFDRIPSLQVILGHWGEVVLFYVERFAAMDRFSKLAHPIATYFRQNLYVTASGMFLAPYLERAATVVGWDRLLFSTDFPFQYRPGNDARRFLDNCGLEDTAKAGFAHENWQRLTANVTRADAHPSEIPDGETSA
jgi:predicted TIM-barrel fold metal-dependent hydrolase